MFTGVCHVLLHNGREAEPYARAAVDQHPGHRFASGPGPRIAVSGGHEERGHAYLMLAFAHLLRDRPDPAATAHAGIRAPDIPDGHLSSTLASAASRLWRLIRPWADDADVQRFGERVASARLALPAGGQA